MDVSQTKIVIISHASIKAVNRSVYRHLANRVKELKLIIPSSIVLSSGKELLAESPIEDAGDPDIITLKLTGVNPRTYTYPELISCLREIKPTIILLENDPVSLLGFQIIRWSRGNNARVICQTYENFSRGLITTVKNQGWRSVIKNQIISLLNYRMALKIDALLVVNKDSESIFTKYGYNNVFRIPLGYDKSVFFRDLNSRLAYRKKLSIDNGTVLIGYFGRLVKQKGVHILIRALGSLKKQNWMLLLDHMHDQEDRYVSHIRELIYELNIEDRVIYFEADHIEIADYMRATDISVAPSITTPIFKEQYGRTVQEAMACGSVSLVSDSGHLKDLVNESHLVFKEGDVNQLANLLSTFIVDNALREKFSLSLQARAELMLTTECQANQLLELVEILK